MTPSSSKNRTYPIGGHQPTYRTFTAGDSTVTAFCLCGWQGNDHKGRQLLARNEAETEWERHFSAALRVEGKRD